jgi:hemolysin III
VWVAALTGIGLRLFVFDGLHPLIGASYIAVGWVALVDAPTLVDHLTGGQFALLLSGGVMYTVGALVLAVRRPNPWPAVFGFHEIFHALVVAAAACHVLITWWLLVDRRH